MNNEKIIKLPKQVEELTSQMEDLANKGTTVEVLERVTKEEIDRQISDGTIANLTIEDDSITFEKTKWIDVIYKNLINPLDDDFLRGYFWYTNNYNTTGGGGANYSISGFIPVEHTYKYRTSMIHKIGFYKADKTTYNDAPFSVDNSKLLDIPKDVKFVRLQMDNKNIDTTAIFHKYIGTYYPFTFFKTEYELFGKSEKYNGLIGNICKNEFINNKIDTSSITGLKSFRWGIFNPSDTHSTPKYEPTYYNYISGFGKVTPSETINGASYNVTGFDNNKNPIGILPWEAGTYKIPENCHYIQAETGPTTNPNMEQVFESFHRNAYGRNNPYSTNIPYADELPVLVDDKFIEWYKIYLNMFPLYNKNILTIGDSFSAPSLWQNVVKSNLKVNIKNTAISGAKFTTAEGIRSAYEQAQKAFNDGFTPDIVVIVLGTNDVNNNIPFGEFVESKNIADFNLNTIYGGIQAVINYCKTTWTDSIIKIGFTPAGGLNLNKGLTLEPVLKDCATRYGIDYINTYCVGYSMLVENDVKYVKSLQDLHPSELGQIKIGEKITELIQ